MTTDAAPPPPPTYSRRGFAEGVRRIVPFFPGLIVFASAFGAAAAQKGLTLWQAMAMSGAVYAGASQLIGLELWAERWTLNTLLAIAAVTATVNARMILMGASLQPWLKEAPAGRNAFNLFFLTDANWLVGTRYRAEGGSDLGLMLGAGVALWVVWVAATVPGHLAGSLMSDPRMLGIDLVMPILFTATAVPLWKGRRETIIWSVAGLVALAASYLLPGYAFIIAGALAGAVTGAFLDD